MINEKKVEGLNIEELTLINRYLTKFAIELKKRGKNSLEIENSVAQERERIFKDIEFMESIGSEINIQQIIKRHAEELGIPIELEESPDVLEQSSELIGLSSLLVKIVSFYDLLRETVDVEKNKAWNGFTILMLFAGFFLFMLFSASDNYYYVFLLGAVQGLLYYYLHKNPEALNNGSFGLLVFSLFGGIELILVFITHSRLEFHYESFVKTFYYYSKHYTYFSTSAITLKIIMLWMFFLAINNAFMLIKVTQQSVKESNAPQETIKEGYMGLLIHFNFLFMLLAVYSVFWSDYIVFLTIFGVYLVLLFKFPFVPSSSTQKENKNPVIATEKTPAIQNRLPRKSVRPVAGPQYKDGVSKNSSPVLAEILNIDPSYASIVSIRLNHARLKSKTKAPFKYYLLSLITLLSVIITLLLLYLYNLSIGLEYLLNDDELSGFVTRYSFYISILLTLFWILYRRKVRLRINKFMHVLTQFLMLDGKTVPVSSLKLPVKLSKDEYSEILKELVMDNVLYLEVDSDRRRY